MRDPLYHDQAGPERLAADEGAMAAVMRMQWLKLASGGIALALIGAIWVVWRWG